MPNDRGIVNGNRGLDTPGGPGAPGAVSDAPAPVATTGATYDPERIQLDESRDTVAGRIRSIIASNSPLARQAQTRAAQQFGRRNLRNSSMAVQAGQEALYSYALPIAQQDAATSFEARRFNTTAGNRALELGATGTQALEQIGASTAGQSRLQAEQGLIQSRLQAEQGDISSRLQAERGAIDERLIGAEGDVRRDLLARQGEIDRQLAELQGSISSRLQAEQGDITSRLQAERADIDERLIGAEGDVRRDLLARQGEIDARLAELQGSISSRLQAEQGQITSQLQAERADIDERLIGAEGDVRERLLARQGEIDLELALVQGDINSRLQAERADIDERLIGAEGDVRQALLERQGEIDIELQNLRTEGALELTDLEMEWRSLIQQNSDAANLYANATVQIGNILANAEIRQRDKQGLINRIRDMLTDSLAALQPIQALPQDDLLNFGPGGSGGGPDLGIAPPDIGDIRV